jgi:hypothetical protein
VKGKLELLLQCPLSQWKFIACPQIAALLTALGRIQTILTGKLIVGEK